MNRHFWVSPARNETADPCDLCGHYGWQEVPGCECCDLTPSQRRRLQREDAKARQQQQGDAR